MSFDRNNEINRPNVINRLEQHYLNQYQTSYTFQIIQQLQYQRIRLSASAQISPRAYSTNSNSFFYTQMAHENSGPSPVINAIPYK